MYIHYLLPFICDLGVLLSFLADDNLKRGF